MTIKLELDTYICSFPNIVPYHSIHSSVLPKIVIPIKAKFSIFYIYLILLSLSAQEKTLPMQNFCNQLILSAWNWENGIGKPQNQIGRGANILKCSTQLLLLPLILCRVFWTSLKYCRILLGQTKVQDGGSRLWMFNTTSKINAFFWPC